MSTYTACPFELNIFVIIWLFSNAFFIFFSRKGNRQMKHTGCLMHIARTMLALVLRDFCRVVNLENNRI